MIFRRDQGVRQRAGRYPRMLGLLLLSSLAACGDDASGGGDAGLGNEAGPQLGDGGVDSDAAGRPACVQISQNVALTPLDMLLALDVSDSMNEGGRWNAVSAALRSFVGREDFAGLGVGVQLFPQRERCVAAAYEQPEVEIAQLPGVREAVEGLLADRGRYGAGLTGGTPLVPMLEGVLATAKRRASAEPDRRVVVVVATDGAPDTTCPARPDDGLPNSIDNVQTVARGGVQGSPSVSTFVIGVGPGLEELDLLAAAGGTEQAVIVDRGSQGETEGAFLAALEDIRIKATLCELEIPEPPADHLEFQFEHVKIDFKFNGRTTRFNRLTGSSACDDASRSPAWYYDDPNTPRRIRLCDSACDFVRQRVGGEIDVVFDCEAPLI